MAFLALRALLPLMLVVFLMAGVTVYRGFLIAIARMAVLAGHLDMLVPELVAGLVVVEPDLFPIPIRMTVGAGASHFPFMPIVFLVATVAIGRRASILNLGLMTGLALDLLRIGMGALEREVRPFMIEGLLRDRCNVFLSAFVICVAFLAFPLLFETPVRSLLLLDVLPNVFVTILAERILCRLVEPLVTLRAVFFPFCMAFDHLPRHQRRLDVVCQGRCGHECQRAEQTKGQVVG